MVTVVIVIHLMVVLAMIGLVLLQRSDGGALGIGGGGGNFMSGRGAGNMLTRSTAIFAAAFFATSIALTVLARIESRPADILDRLQSDAAVSAPVPAAPVAPVPADAPAQAPTTNEAPTAQSVLDSLGPQTPEEPAAPAPAAPAPASSAPDSAPQAPAAPSGQGQ